MARQGICNIRSLSVKFNMNVHFKIIQILFCAFSLPVFLIKHVVLHVYSYLWLSEIVHSLILLRCNPFHTITLARLSFSPRNKIACLQKIINSVYLITAVFILRLKLNVGLLRPLILWRFCVWLWSRFTFVVTIKLLKKATKRVRQIWKKNS